MSVNSNKSIIFKIYSILKDTSNTLPCSMTVDDFERVGVFESTDDFILRLTGFSFSKFSFAELFLVPWLKLDWPGLDRLFKVLECFIEFSRTKTHTQTKH